MGRPCTGCRKAIRRRDGGRGRRSIESSIGHELHRLIMGRPSVLGIWALRISRTPCNVFALKIARRTSLLRGTPRILHRVQFQCSRRAPLYANAKRFDFWKVWFFNSRKTAFPRPLDLRLSARHRRRAEGSSKKGQVPKLRMKHCAALPILDFQLSQFQISALPLSTSFRQRETDEVTGACPLNSHFKNHKS